MTARHRLDIHILTMPDRPWLERCLASLPGDHVNVIISDGIEDQMGIARLKSYEKGSADLVCYVDDDDEVAAPAVISALARISGNESINGICTWRRIDFGDGTTSEMTPKKWTARKHYFGPSLYHQVCIMRRDLMMPIAYELRHEGLCFDPALMLHYAARHGLTVWPELGYVKHVHPGSILQRRRHQHKLDLRRHLHACRDALLNQESR